MSYCSNDSIKLFSYSMNKTVNHWDVKLFIQTYQENYEVVFFITKNSNT